MPVRRCKLLVVVVALVLHAGGHGHHGQVVGVHDVVDVAGQPRENSVMGISRELPPPAAVPLTFMVGPPEADAGRRRH
jgi:hypothetical protein